MSANTVDTDAEDMASVEEGTVDANLMDSMTVIYPDHAFTTVKEESNLNNSRRVLQDDRDLESSLSSIKSLIINMQKTFTNRLDCIEKSIEKNTSRLDKMEQRIDIFVLKQTNTTTDDQIVQKTGQKRVYSSGSPPSSPASTELATDTASINYVTLNTESDYPDGSWLGDENNVNERIRTPISPANLLHVNTNCRTAEKMALTLLDYLFDRETQAVSNLSGMGKHGKRQLDPLMIYAIRAHLRHHFQITDTDWHRIKQNIDSKCRTAFRRRMKGMPLTVKAFKNSRSNHSIGYLSDSSENLAITSMDDVNMSQTTDIQVFHATQEQLEAIRSGRMQVIHHGNNDSNEVHISAVPLNSDTIPSYRIVTTNELPASNDVDGTAE